MMRNYWYGLAACGVMMIAAQVRADDAAAKAVVDKAIQAAGGEAALKKLDAATFKMKGTVEAMGMTIEFSADIAAQSWDQQRTTMEFAIGDMKFTFVQVVNRDKGWIKINDMLMEMDADKLAEVKHLGYAQWLTSLLPLKSKELTLALVGDAKVGDDDTVAIKVSGKDRRDVTLYFDKKTHLLRKSETRVKDDATGEEVNQETLMSGYTDKGPKVALKMSVLREGKKFVEAELSDFRTEDKLDDSTFAKP